MKFSELGLAPKVLKAVEETGYETPTPIQAQAIPVALQGRDVLGIAQTGTGKTASFTLPMLTLLSRGRARARMPRSLILAPTRELAAQVSENFDTYGKYLNLSKALLIGGVSFADQDRIIDRGVDVLIATPGRLLDHFERGKLMLTGIEILVVDEADRMLDMGFIEDLERIFKLTPFTRQTLFFSATMPPEITRLTNEFLSNPERVEVARAASTVDTIAQRLCKVPGARGPKADVLKRAALRAILEQEKATLTNGIIFCNRKRDVSVLYKSLTKHGYNCGALHGDLDQRVRMQVLDGFRKDQITLLVASDVAARGLDIPRVSHVFNFDVPINAEDYVHRIGRTGRAGREGVAYTLSAPSDAKLLAKVEELIGKEIPEVEVEGLTDALEDASGDESGRGAKPRGRRNERASEDAEGKSAEASSREASGEREERRGRRRRRNEPETAEATEAAETAPKADSGDNDTGSERKRPRRGRNRRDDDGDDRRDDDGDDRRGDRKPVVGLGDHVPAFLLREVPLPSRRKAAASEEDGESQSADDAEAVATEEAPANEKPAPKRTRRRAVKAAAQAADDQKSGDQDSDVQDSDDDKSSDRDAA